MYTLTAHATTRSQQRGIPKAAIALVIKYGRKRHCGDDNVTHWMDRQSRQKASLDPTYRNHADRLDFYVVTDQDEQIVTVAWPNGRKRAGHSQRRRPNRAIHNHHPENDANWS